MTNEIIAEANVELGTVIHREMTKKEIAADLKHREECEKIDAAYNQNKLLKQSVLDKLGLTDEEMKSLLS